MKVKMLVKRITSLSVAGTLFAATLINGTFVSASSPDEKSVAVSNTNAEKSVSSETSEEISLQSEAEEPTIVQFGTDVDFDMAAEDEAELKSDVQDGDVALLTAVSPQSLNTLNAGSTVTLKQGDKLIYPSNWGARSTRYFTVTIDGVEYPCYCLEPDKDSSLSGDYVVEELNNNTALVKALYYCYGAPGASEYLDKQDWSYATYSNGVDCPAWLSQYVLSHMLASYFYDSTGAFTGQSDQEIANSRIYDFINFVNSAPAAPEVKISLAPNKVSASYDKDNNVQRTKNITLSGSKQNSIVIPLQQGVTLYNVITGKKGTGNVTVHGGDVFYLSAPLNLAVSQSASWKSGAIAGTLNGIWRTIVFGTGGGYQNQGGGFWGSDPTNTVELEVEWLELGNIALQKVDAETGQDAPQGLGSLSGAIYEVTDKDGKVVGTIKTNAKGQGTLENIPYGDYTVKEKTASQGYLLDEKAYKVTLPSKESDPLTVNAKSKEQPIRGGIKVAKWSLETDSKVPQGAASLSGAKFQIINNNSVPVTVDGTTYDKNAVIKEVTTGADGTWTSSSTWLLAGSYKIKEISAPEGYLNAGVTERIVEITEHGKIVDLDTADGAIKNQVVRGDLKFVKIGDGDAKRLANVPFKITSKTTGESHVIMTDKNGQADTSSDWNKHTYNTNAGKTSNDGVWFSGTKSVTVKPDDAKGALPYDTYIVEEQRCDSNKGYNLLNVEISVYKNNNTLDMGTLTDDIISIGTKAHDEITGTNVASAEGKVTIIDEVSYTGLQKGKEYKLVGSIMDKAGKAVSDKDGKPITATKTFTPKQSTGTTSVEFTFDASTLRGTDIVVFEKLYLGTDMVAVHEDPTDDDQTIHFPEIGTTAIDADTETNVSNGDKEVKIIDTVSYKNLEVGKEYDIFGTLMDKETGKPVRDKDGNKITAKTSFKAESESGTVEVTFIFDGRDLTGKTLVAFEDLLDGDKLYATHADIEDEAQTVYIPKIGTTATIDGKHEAVATDKEITITDKVSYENLTPGKKYTVSGILMDKSTKKPLLVNGNKITVKKEFTADKAKGSVSVEFKLNTKEFAGKDIVVFEEVYMNGKLIAAHEDINDKGQTVKLTATKKVVVPPKASSSSPKASVAKSVKTGDDSMRMIVILGSILLIAGSAIIVLIINKANMKKM